MQILNFWFKKKDWCKIKFKKSSTTKVGEHIPSKYSMSMIWTFYGMENKHNIYRGENCMKNYRESLRDYAMNIFNFGKKKIMQLTNEQQDSHQKGNIC